MTFVVVYDTCALYGSTVRNLLIRVAKAGLVQAKWSERILDELCRSLVDKRGIDPGKVQRLRRRMIEAIPTAVVVNYQSFEDVLELPDREDRHVLAAAIKGGAQEIVTANTRDFPTAYLARWGIGVKTPDEFVLDLLDLDRSAVHDCVEQIAEERRNPPETLDEVLGQLERGGLIETAIALRLSM